MRWESASKRFSRDFRRGATIEVPHSGVEHGDHYLLNAIQG